MAALSLTACSSDEPTLDDAKSSPDAAAVDAAAVEDLVDRYWDAVVKSENTVDDNPKQFSDVADGPFIERQLKTVRDYDEAGISRVGKPAITDVEVAVSGDTAQVEACLNEDDWKAKQNGKTIKAPKLGPKPWGAVAEKRDDTWVITEVGGASDDTKEC